MAALRTLRSTLQPTTSSILNSTRTFSTSQARTNMARMNIIGRLASAPEMSQTSSGQTMFKYALGTSSGPTEARQTSWFNIVMFAGDPSTTSNAQGQERRVKLMEDLEKGTMLYVEADARMQKFAERDENGRETGRERKALGLVQRSMQILSRPNRDQGTNDPANAAGNADGAHVEAGI